MSNNNDNDEHFFDSAGCEVSLEALIRKEPEWAASRIRTLTAQLDAADAEIEAWKDASGLIDASGDPDGVTPAAARRWWSDLEARSIALSKAIERMRSNER